VIVLDTSVLSAVFRRRKATEPESAAVATVRRMISEDWPLSIPGVVLQELLSGVRLREQFRILESLTDGFPLLLAGRREHVLAARISNTCRRTGVSVSTVDCLIAAQTIAVAGRLFTLDNDFERIAALTDLKLVAP